MSSTSKGRIEALKPSLDMLFSNAHPGDVEEIAKELREFISRAKSAKRTPSYDGKHFHAATAH